MKIILICILLQSPAAFCTAFFSSEPEGVPGGTALLWIPAEGSDWEQVLDTISRRPDLRVTIALPSISRSGISKLKQLVSSGRLEVAMRLSGDPVLPLLFYPNNPNVRWENRPDTIPWPDRPDEMASRLSTAWKKHMKIFKDAPSGWVPTAGGVIPESLPIARALGLTWIAAGPAGDAPAGIFDIGGVSLVPFALLNSTSPIETMCSSPLTPCEAGPTCLCLVAFDETLETDHDVRDRFLSVINSPPSSPPARWLTVSQAVSESLQFEVRYGSSAVILPWTGDYSLWTKVPAQIAALENLNEARQVYNSYVNSGQANWKILRKVTRKFLSMESGERILRLASPDSKISGKARTELETGLADIYTQIGKPVPSYLPHPPKSGRMPEVPSQTAGAEALKRGTTAFVTIESGPSWIRIRNPDKRLDLPHPLPELEPGSDPYNIWKLDSILITWDDDEFRICFTPVQIDNSDNAPSGFSHILMDLYIDMNHRLGSGLLPLLKDRKIRTAPEDAWEYALTVTGWKANLFKAGSQGPVLIGSYMPRLSRQTGRIYITIPRKVIRGNPSLWGYMAAVMALVPGGTHNEPQGVPFVPDSGEHLIDILASERIKGSLYSLRLPK